MTLFISPAATTSVSRRPAERLAGAPAQVRGHVLDVRDTHAVDAFASELLELHGGADIVFSNAYARITPDEPSAEVIGMFVDTNNLGATRMLRAFAPILRPGGRLLVVASSLGSLRQLPPALHERFDTDAITLEDLDATMLAWRDAVTDGRAADEGWPDWINIPSKVGQVPAVRMLARERRRSRRDARRRRVPRPDRHRLLSPLVSRDEPSGNPGPGRRPLATARSRSDRGSAPLRRADPVRQRHSVALSARGRRAARRREHFRRPS